MKKYIIILFSVILGSLSGFAENKIQKETYVYSSKDGKELSLDKYNIDDSIKNKPCVIFMFGGGFTNGERDNKEYLPFFNSLVESGNVVLSIDYRRGLKDIKSSSLVNSKEDDFVKLFANTLTMAAEDLMDATTYAIFHAEKWNIDKNKIIVSGSSAGAIIALHGEYATANRLEIAQKLPIDFRYAGVISFAGAIFSMYGDLNWKEKPSPMLLFHGSADKNVPYNAIELGYLGFYGSKHIAKQLDMLKVSYYFYDEEYQDHTLSTTPMHENLELINSFVTNEIIGKKGQRIHTIVKVNDRESVNTSFSIKDYILANFPQRY